tara:strand:+ start:67 stop:858 length:792 start_codon:yes stop_codon:yes gene_type:complete
MDQLKQYIFITSFTVITLILISCGNSSDTNDYQTVKTNATTNISNNETVFELNKEKLISKNTIDKGDFVLPNGYKLFDKIQGDLNNDGKDDYFLIVKGTDKEKIVLNRFDKEVDRNRRGILIYLTNNGKDSLITKNLNCFLSENEDGGVYFPPQLTIYIENGKLYLHYCHGRYGYWKYTFRYQNSDFELIGYDSSEKYGPIVNREISINFLTKKKFTRENVNKKTQEGGDEIFEETWEDIKTKELRKLSEIKDFSELDINREN